MRLRNPLRFVPILGLCLVLTAPGPFELSPAARAQESAPTSVSKTLDGNAVLTSRRLTRVANVYLLKEEIDAKDAIKEGEDALKQMEALGESRRQTVVQNQERLAILDQDLSTQKQQRNNLNQQKQGFSDQNLLSGDVNTQIFNKNQMQQIDNQIRDKQDSIDRLNQSYTQTQSRLQTELASLRELESEYASKKSAYERRFQHVKAKYQPLMKDPEVVRALKQLNRSARPWVMIGPHWEYDKNVRSLAQLIVNEAGLEVSYTIVSKHVGRKTTKVKVPRVSLGKQEKEVRADGYKAWMLSSKLKGAEGATNRKSLAAAVPPLKKRIGEIQKAYTDLSQDTLITSAIELIAPGGKLDPTDEFKTSVKRLPDLEKALNTTR